MSSSTTEWIPAPLAEDPHIQVLDASMEAITTKLDAVLTDSLKATQLMSLMANMMDPEEEVSKDTLIRAYELAVHDCAASLAQWADEIAAMVPGDGRIADPRVKEQAAKDAAAVAAEARTLMADNKL
ncbi:hypothetical protein E8E11_011905 [Didymella keratinophila]|nr:hypothetical protein E8E11_011905 [Didymella keratinophila]